MDETAARKGQDYVGVSSPTSTPWRLLFVNVGRSADKSPGVSAQGPDSRLPMVLTCPPPTRATPQVALAAYGLVALRRIFCLLS